MVSWLILTTRIVAWGAIPAPQALELPAVVERRSKVLEEENRICGICYTSPWPQKWPWWP